MVGVTSSRNLLSKSDNLDEVIAGFLSRWERTQYLFSEGVVRIRNLDSTETGISK